MAIDRKTEEMAIAFEQKHGAIPLLKVVMSVFSRILVDKEICTADELQEALRSTMAATENDKETPIFCVEKKEAKKV